MKTIVMCEGKYDRIFFKEIVSKLFLSEDIVNVFDQNTRSVLSNLKNAESKEIQKFLDAGYPHRILVKSEGGKNKVFAIFSFFMNFFFEGSRQNKIKNIIIMLDIDKNELDETHLKEEIDYLDNEIICRKRGDPIYLEHKIIENKNSICLVENSVKIKANNEEVGKFLSILFHSSLEKKTGINDIDTEEIKRAKINDYLDIDREANRILKIAFS